VAPACGGHLIRFGAGMCTGVQITSAVAGVIRKDSAASFDSHGGDPENASGGSGMKHIWRWHTGKEGLHFDKIRRSDECGV